jgi:hypothetical protein
MLISVATMGEITNPLINLAEVMEYRGCRDKYIIPLKMVFLVSFISLRLTLGRGLVQEI